MSRFSGPGQGSQTLYAGARRDPRPARRRIGALAVSGVSSRTWPWRPSRRP
jgi:hypothetical protein